MAEGRAEALANFINIVRNNREPLATAQELADGPCQRDDTRLVRFLFCPIPKFLRSAQSKCNINRLVKVRAPLALLAVYKHTAVLTGELSIH